VEGDVDVRHADGRVRSHHPEEDVPDAPKRDLKGRAAKRVRSGESTLSSTRRGKPPSPSLSADSDSDSGDSVESWKRRSEALKQRREQLPTLDATSLLQQATASRARASTPSPAPAPQLKRPRYAQPSIASLERTVSESVGSEQRVEALVQQVAGSARHQWDQRPREKRRRAGLVVRQRPRPRSRGEGARGLARHASMSSTFRAASRRQQEKAQQRQHVGSPRR